MNQVTFEGMHVHKLCLYNFDWQILRVGLNFTNADNVQVTVKKLEEYLESPLSEDDTRLNRLWRILNLLNATMMGYRGQRKRFSDKPERIEMLDMLEAIITSYRSIIQQEYQLFKEKEFHWDYAAELERLKSASLDNLLSVRESLGKRRKFATDKKKVDVKQTRPELVTYIDMLDVAIRHKATKEEK